MKINEFGFLEEFLKRTNGRYLAVPDAYFDTN